MNKKAELFMVSFVILVIIAFLLGAYIYIFNKVSLETGSLHQRELVSEYAGGSSLVFSNYFRTPVMIDGEDGEIYDLVAVACVNESYVNQLVEETQKYMVLAQKAESETNPPSYSLNWLFTVECKNGEILFAESYLSMMGRGDLLDEVHILDRNGDLIKVNKYSVLGTKVWFDEVHGAADTYGLVADTHPGLLEAYKQSQTYMSLSSSLSAIGQTSGLADPKDLTYIINELDKDYLFLIITTFNKEVLIGKVKITEEVEQNPSETLRKWLLPIVEEPGMIKNSEGEAFSYFESLHIKEMRVIAKNIYDYYKEENQ